MPVAPLDARATETSKPTGLQTGSTNPIVIVLSTSNLHDLENSGLTRSTGHSNRIRAHLYIDSTLRICCKATATKLLHQPKQGFKMAVLGEQGQTAAFLQEKVGSPKHTGPRNFIRCDQYINKRIYHSFPGRHPAKRWRQSQHFNPQHHDPSSIPPNPPPP